MLTYSAELPFFLVLGLLFFEGDSCFQSPFDPGIKSSNTPFSTLNCFDEI